MSPLLRIKLLVGRLVDWDPDSAKVLGVILAINAGLFGYLGLSEIVSGEDSCNAQCQAEAERFVDEVLQTVPTPDVQKIIDDVIQRSR